MVKRSLLAYLKLWSLTTLLLVTAFLVWSAVHEISHYYACSVIGGFAELSSWYPQPKISCFGIVSSGSLMISQTSFFFYMMIPYIIALSLLMILIHLKWPSFIIRYAIVLAITLESVLIYISAAFTTTDFSAMRAIHPSFMLLGNMIFFSIVLLAVPFLLSSFERFIRSCIRIFR